MFFNPKNRVILIHRMDPRVVRLLGKRGWRKSWRVACEGLACLFFVPTGFAFRELIANPPPDRGLFLLCCATCKALLATPLGCPVDCFVKVCFSSVVQRVKLYWLLRWGALWIVLSKHLGTQNEDFAAPPKIAEIFILG